MVYESGFTSRRTYTSRPVVTSYAVSRPTKNPIDWEKCPFVPRPSLITEPITAFGRRHTERGECKSSILDPINRADIKPSRKVLSEPIKLYVPVRDKNRERIYTMVRQYIDSVETGGNTTVDNLHSFCPQENRNVSKCLSVRREKFRNPKSGAMVTKYVY